MSKYTDAEILDLWKNQNRTQEDLVRYLVSADRIKAADARRRVERITTAEMFRMARKPVPKEWE